MELLGMRVIVVGLGKSGASAARLCVSRGARVLGTDRAGADSIAPEALSLGIELCLGGHEAVDFMAADLIVVSPGVPSFAELERAEGAGVEVIGELELASRFIDVPLLVVGGTNGKSTTTMLLGEILKAEGARVFVGGNLGTPACEAASGVWDLVVLEVSSFQAERVPTLRPRVSVLLNVTDDHLDRYATFADYAQAKGNVFAQQTPEDAAIVLYGDPLLADQARRGRARLLTFGGEGDYQLLPLEILERESGERFSLEGARLFGAPNLLNAAAAVAAARAAGASCRAVALGLRQFEPLAHRMQLVREVGGVRYYDDSKATNVGAAVAALEGLAEPRAVVILGGRDKLGSYAPLVAALKRRARCAVLLGESRARLAGAISGQVPLCEAETMQQAVELSRERARPGDAVLLSPACSSFDMFANYHERGLSFQRAVLDLEERAAS